MSSKNANGKRTAAPPLLNIGYGNVVMKNRIIAMIAPNSSPVKRLIDEARQQRKLVDASQGRRIRALIITDSEHVVLSAVALETMVQRFQGREA
jgi:hypothetical protein